MSDELWVLELLYFAPLTQQFNRLAIKQFNLLRLEHLLTHPHIFNS